MTAPRIRTPAAFTLVEVLVVLGLIVVLAALLAGTFSTIRERSGIAQRTRHLQEIGGLIVLHAADHGGLLPGPLWPGQIPVYDRARPGRLAVELAPYLGIAEDAPVQVVPLFLPAAFEQAAAGRIAPADLRTYVMRMSMPVGGSQLSPWGSLAVEPPATPARMAAIVAAAPRSWAVSEADQKHPGVAAAPWAANTLAQPIAGKRLAWFFNGSVSQLEAGDLE